MLGRICAVLLFTTAGFAAAADNAPTTAELDKAAIEAFKVIHNKGAVLYNAGDYAGCLKVYETGLMAVKPFLTHRKPLQTEIEKALAEATVKPENAKSNAFALHEAIAQFRGELKVEAKK